MIVLTRGFSDVVPANEQNFCLCLAKKKKLFSTPFKNIFGEKLGSISIGCCYPAENLSPVPPMPQAKNNVDRRLLPWT